MLAKDDRIQYAKGSWLNHARDCGCYGIIHHGWNTVDGYVVDLSEEYYNWLDPDDKPAPERASHTIFTYDEVGDYYDNYVGEFDPDAWNIISREYWLSDGGLEMLPAHLKEKNWNFNDDEWGEINDLHFKEATERLQARIQQRASGSTAAELVAA
jgi:hypothetical protein